MSKDIFRELKVSFSSGFYSKTQSGQFSPEGLFAAATIPVIAASVLNVEDVADNIQFKTSGMFSKYGYYGSANLVITGPCKFDPTTNTNQRSRYELEWDTHITGEYAGISRHRLGPDSYECDPTR